MKCFREIMKYDDCDYCDIEIIIWAYTKIFPFFKYCKLHTHIKRQRTQHTVYHDNVNQKNIILY